jgi:hypothetical protein
MVIFPPPILNSSIFPEEYYLSTVKLEAGQFLLPAHGWSSLITGLITLIWAWVLSEIADLWQFRNISQLVLWRHGNSQQDSVTDDVIIIIIIMQIYFDFILSTVQMELPCRNFFPFVWIHFESNDVMKYEKNIASEFLSLIAKWRPSENLIFRASVVPFA